MNSLRLVFIPGAKLLLLSSLSILCMWIFVSSCFNTCAVDIGNCVVRHDLFFLLHVYYSLKIIQPFLYIILVLSIISSVNVIYYTTYYKHLALQLISYIIFIAKNLFNMGIAWVLNFWQLTIVLPVHTIKFLQTKQAILPEV